MGEINEYTVGAMILNRYLVLKRISNSFYESRYLVKDTLLNTDVALRILSPERVQEDKNALTRFVEEAKAAVNLIHANLLKTYSIERTEKTAYIVSEPPSGVSIKQLLLDQIASRQFPSVLMIISQVCEALAYAHQSGYFHGYITSENTFILVQDRVKIAEPIGGWSRNAQLKDKDIAAVGRLLFELLTGVKPKHDEEVPGKYRADVPVEIEQLVMRAMKNETGHAFTSMQALYEAVHTLYDLIRLNKLASKPGQPDDSQKKTTQKTKTESSVSQLVLLHMITRNPKLLDFLEKIDPEFVRAEISTPESQPLPQNPSVNTIVHTHSFLHALIAPLGINVTTDSKWYRRIRYAVLILIAIGLGRSVLGTFFKDDSDAVQTVVVSPTASPEIKPTTQPIPEKLTVASIQYQMVYIPAGTFIMGSPEGEIDRSTDEKQHQVTITKPFYMGATEVSQKQWKAIMGSCNSEFQGDDLPVERVSWFDVIEFCNKLSQTEGLKPCYYTISETSVDWDASANGYRLPTEAEWEYACRAGSTTPFNTGVNLTTDQANYNGNYPYNNAFEGEYRTITISVTRFKPNLWGLYNMHGNVWEWCWDWYGNYPTSSVLTDPSGLKNGSARVNRGGGWDNYALNCRSAYRVGDAPDARYISLGFRLARFVSLGT